MLTHPHHQYYDAQWLSLRNAVWRPANFKNTSGLSWKEIMADDLFHPGDLGHKIMADLVVWLIQQTAIDMMMRPIGK